MCWTYIYQYAEAIGISSENAANYQFICFIVFLIGAGPSVPTYCGLSILGNSYIPICCNGRNMCFGNWYLLKELSDYMPWWAFSFFMSLMFPTIYGIALEDLDEKESKIGAAGLVMAIVGGALMPKLQGMIIDLGGSGVSDMQILGVSEVNFSFLLPYCVLCSLLIMVIT